MLKHLINLFIKQNGRKPNAIELLQLRFKALEEVRQQNKIIKPDFKSIPRPKNQIMGSEGIKGLELAEDRKKRLLDEGKKMMEEFKIKQKELRTDLQKDAEEAWALRKHPLKEFTKKEDVYEGMIDPKSDLGKKLDKLRRRGDETEQQLKIKMELENKKAAERIRKKKIKDFEEKNERALEDYVDDAGGTKEGVEFDDEPFDAASGGRAGFKVGGILDLLNLIKGKFGKKSITTADKLTRPESALTRQLFEEFNKKYSKKPEVLKGDEVLTKQGVSFENKIKNQLETTYDDISGGSGFTSGDYKYDAQVLADGIAEDLGFAFDDLPINQQTQLYNAALSRISKDLQMKRILKKASKPTETLKSIKETGGINISNPKVAEEFTRFMKETDPKGFKELEQKIQIEAFDPKGKKGHAEGGIAGQLHLHEGGRVALGSGGPSNKGRRNFLKLMAGLASIPILGKLFKFAKPAAKITQLKNTTTHMPAWFPKFVDKYMARSVGKKIDADIMEFENPDLPNIKVTRHDDGRTFVQGNNEYNEGYAIDYKPPGYEVIDEKTGKAVKTPGDFEAVEGRHVALGPEDYDTDPFFVDDLDELTTIDVAEMEKYSTGKVTKTVKDAFGQDTGVKKGLRDYDMAVGRAENEADVLRDADLLDKDFAKGGRVGMLAGGGLLKAMLRNLAKEKGMSGSEMLAVMNYKALPSKIRNLMTPKQFQELKDARLKGIINFKDMMETRVNFDKSIRAGKALDDQGTGISDMFDYINETFTKKSPVPKNVTEKDVLEMEQMIKNIEMKGRKSNAKGGRVSLSKGGLAGVLNL